jgi:hypothetical protein
MVQQPLMAILFKVVVAKAWLAYFQLIQPPLILCNQLTHILCNHPQPGIFIAKLS